MTVDPQEDSDQNRGEDKNNPRAVFKFCHGKNAHHNPCAECAEPIADHFDEPATFVMQSRMVLRNYFVRIEAPYTPPPPCHPSLCKSERQEHTDCVQRDEACNTCLKYDDQDTCYRRE